MPVTRLQLLVARALLLLVLLPQPAKAQAPALRVASAQLDGDSTIEAVVACGPEMAQGASFSMAIDGGAPIPIAAPEPVNLPLSLAIVVEIGPTMNVPGTPYSTRAQDAIGQIDALLARLPADSQLAMVVYAGSAELLVPLRADGGGARNALVQRLASAMDEPDSGPRAFAEAVGLATEQLRAAPSGPHALIVYAASSGVAPSEQLANIQLSATIVGLNAESQVAMEAVAAMSGGIYLPYHSAELAALPGLNAALEGRYAALVASRANLRLRAEVGTLGSGAHLLKVVGCGATAEIPIEREPTTGSWPAPLAPGLAAGGGVACTLAAYRLAARNKRSGRARAPSRQTTARYQAATGAPTERRAPATRQAAALYTLAVRNGNQRSSYELNGRQCVIGREPGCELLIDNPWVSLLHARLSIANGQLAITDLDSSNGTSIGAAGHQLTPNRPEALAEGDEFWLGPEVQIEVRRTNG